MMIERESRCESGWNCRPGALKSLSAETFIQLRHISEEPFQFALPRHVRRRSTRPTEPCVEHFPRQPVLGARLSRRHDKLVHALRIVRHLFASTEPINRQAHRLVEGPRIQFDGMLDPIRILERNPAPLHAMKPLRVRPAYISLPPT